MKVQFEKLVLAALVFLSIESAVADQGCDPSCTVKVVNAHPPHLLGDMAAQLGIQIVFEGDLLEPVSVEIEEKSVDQLVRTVADMGGYLVKRKGTRYTLYGANVEEVTIALTPRHIKAEEGAQHLDEFENVGVLVLEAANSIVLRGTSDNVRRAVDLLYTIDFDLPNVFLELLVVEYYHENDFVWAYDIVSGEKGKVSNLLVLPGSGTLSGSYEALADLPKSFRLNLTALVQDSEARVVTNPHVAVRSGEPGRIELKEELNIILSNETANFGVTRSLETLEAGVMLDVTPVVLDDGYVDLQVEGEVSVFVPAAQGEFAIARQTVTTKLLLESGKTLVIGGLVLKESAETDSGVPGLRKLPLLGNLFKSRSNAGRYIETVIYITPFINDPSLFHPETIDDDVEEHFNAL